MSFLLDIILIGVLLAVVAVNWRRSIFAAATAAVALAVAATGAMLLTDTLTPRVTELVTAPLAEQRVGNELADMFSAPHLSSGRETVASLPLEELVTAQPEAYIGLLEEYSVSPKAVEAAFAADPRPVTVLTAITHDYAAAFARTIVLVGLTAVFTLLLRLIAHRLEQNLPPLRAYRGFKRCVPGLIGVVSGIILLWTLVPVIGWLVPVTAGQTLMFTPGTLEQAEWYTLLRLTDPLLLLI